MRTTLKTVLTATVLAAGLAAAPALYADSAGHGPENQAATKDHGTMMGQGKTMRPDSMATMATMTKLMGQMMAEHGKAMQTMLEDHGAARPDTQPDKK